MTAGTEEQRQRGLALAVAHLNRRERTVGEVRAHLGRKGLDDHLADSVIQTLVDDGYLDDSRYAEMFVHDKRSLDGWGSERIRRELTARGLDRQLIESALADDEDDRDGETELDRAVALLRRRFPSPPADRRARDRALGVLIRRGFDGELALDALTAYVRDG